MLGFVEAVDLVHEEKRCPPVFPARSGGFEDFLEVGHAGKDRGDRLKVKLTDLRHEPRQRGLATTRRPPKDGGDQAIALHHLPQRRPVSQQLLLPHNLVEGLRPQSVRERPLMIN